nr:NADH dehydrogenase subunit 2 [Hoplopleura pacifica]
MSVTMTLLSNTTPMTKFRTNKWNLIFQMFMVIGTLMTVSSSSWLSTWLGMELTVLFFLPFLSSLGWFSSVSTLWQFFLYSVISSMVFLISGSVSSSVEILDWAEAPSFASLLALILVIVFKLAFPPLHGWSLVVLGGLPWVGVFMFSTVLKIAPIYITLNVFSILCGSGLPLALSVPMVTMIIMTLRALSSSSLRNILVYFSSLSGGWLILSSLVSDCLTVVYCLMYFVSLWALTKLLSAHGASTVQELTLSHMSPLEKFVLLSSLMNLAGVPPSLGFFVKVSIIGASIESLSLVPFTLVMVSTIFTYNFLLMLSSLLLAKKGTFFNPLHSMKSNLLLMVALTTFFII